MGAPFTLKRLSSSKGYSVVELLIVLAMVLMIIGYVWTQMTLAQRSHSRSNAAQQFTNYLETARNDSMRRHAMDPSQMAQVTILNDSFYSVTIDANGDGALDAPLVVSLAEQHLTINGPFPRTLMFDRLGKTVDSTQNSISPEAITFTNRSGKSVVKLSDAGKPSVIQPGSTAIATK